MLLDFGFKKFLVQFWIIRKDFVLRLGEAAFRKKKLSFSTIVTDNKESLSSHRGG